MHFFLSFSSNASFLEFAILSTRWWILGSAAMYRTRRCNKDGYLWLTWPHSSTSLIFIFLFPPPPASLPRLIIAGCLSLLQQSFSGSLINCLLSVGGVRRSVVHAFTSSAGLFSALTLLSGVPSAKPLIRLLSWDGRWRAEEKRCILLRQTFSFPQCLPSTYYHTILCGKINHHLSSKVLFSAPKKHENAKNSSNLQIKIRKHSYDWFLWRSYWLFCSNM